MSASERQAGLGELLTDAQKGSFFRWFHLRLIEGPAVERLDASSPGAARRRFRPSGESFHRLVELALDVDAEGRIEAASLGLDRAFIDSPSIRPFARDIAKSFLTWILPPAAAEALQPDIERISAFSDGESVVIAHAAAPRERWRPWRSRPEADAADVFIGAAVQSEKRVGWTRIRFENLSAPLPNDVASPGPIAPSLLKSASGERLPPNARLRQDRHLVGSR